MIVSLRKQILPFLAALLLAGSHARADNAAGAPPAAIDPQLGPPFRPAERPTLGPADAPLVVIELTSFLCSHCQAFHEREFPTIRKRFIDTGLVRWVVVNAPKADEQNAPAFAIARGALRAGLYWELADSLFREAHRPASGLFAALARPGGPDAAEIERWARDETNQREVAADHAEFTHLSVGATPYFLLRKRTPDGRYVQARIKGYESAAYFANAIGQMLEK
ncbi:hypothetical protein OPIT5_30260 [Opitutaceae bacterium TAV5]|nr:hypothetical protein OPIT5_30260 [Opitutaceae bacterium TAV5]